MTNSDRFLIETEDQTGEDYTGLEANNIPGCESPPYLITEWEGVEVDCINGLYQCD